MEETKNYTTQALASVAYQISTLASSFMALLDVQSNQLAEMESSVNHLAQVCDVTLFDIRLPLAASIISVPVVSGYCV